MSRINDAAWSTVVHGSDAEALRERIYQFDKVIREICEALEIDYAGVDCDDGSIVAEIKALRLALKYVIRIYMAPDEYDSDEKEEATERIYNKLMDRFGKK